MNALATLFISAVTIGVIVANQIMMAREKKRMRDMQMAFTQPDPAEVEQPAAPVGAVGAPLGRRAA
jgi:putrescine transport system permease protein